MNNFLPGLSRFLLAALCIALVAPVEAAIVMLPEATYHADLNFPLPAKHLSTVGSIGIDRNLVTGTGVNRGHVKASAGTTDGLQPTAAISVDLSGTGHGANSADAVASLIYYWKVEQIAGPPRNTAQVLIHVEGEVSSAIAGDAGASVYAEAVIFFIGSHASFVAGTKPGVPFTGNSFDRTFTRQVSTQSEFWTTLFARGTAEVSFDDAPGTARMDAFADPLIEIDPAWEHASDFRVVFSSGVGVAVVPEPAAYLLWAAGLAVLGRCVWRRAEMKRTQFRPPAARLDAVKAARKMCASLFPICRSR